MKPHFFVLTCNSCDNLAHCYKDLLRKTWGDDCVILLYDSNHKELAEDAARKGWRTEVFDWDSTIAKMDSAGWTRHYAARKKVVAPARLAAYDVARKLGIRFFMELDDDWNGIQIPSYISDQLPSRKRLYIKKEPEDFAIKYFKSIVERIFDLVEETGSTIAFVQSGELLSADVSHYHFKPKTMNTFILDTENPMPFGGFNEDVNVYCRRNMEKPCFQVGYLIWSHGGSQLRQGIEYTGTWEKTFATVIVNPTATRLSTFKNMGAGNDDNMNYSRIHHNVQYERTQPKHVWPVEEEVK